MVRLDAAGLERISEVAFEQMNVGVQGEARGVVSEPMSYGVAYRTVGQRSAATTRVFEFFPPKVRHVDIRPADVAAYIAWLAKQPTGLRCDQIALALRAARSQACAPTWIVSHGDPSGGV